MHLKLQKVCLAISIAIMCMCLLFYVLLYNHLDVTFQGNVEYWSYIRNRDPKVYMKPFSKTSIHEPTYLCPSSEMKDKQLFLLILVTSSTTNFENRNAVRETWGSYANYLKLTEVLQKVRGYGSNHLGSFRDLSSNIDHILDANQHKANIHLLKGAKAFSENESILLKKYTVKTIKETNNNVGISINNVKYNNSLNKDIRNIHNNNLNKHKTTSKRQRKIENKAKDQDLQVLKQNNKINSIYNKVTKQVNRDDLKVKDGIKLENKKDVAKIDKKETKNKQAVFKLAFLLGAPSGGDKLSVQHKIEEEVSKYGDIIQEDFIDTYHNLSLKSLMLLKWVTNNCGNARFILKTDDDVYVNTPNLINCLHKQYTQRDHREENSDNDDKNEYVLTGALVSGARPSLDVSDKWFMPKYMYSEKEYPPYVSGTGYIMSMAAARTLYVTALFTPYVYLEDIYITGICAKSATPRIHPTRSSGFSFGKWRTGSGCSPYSRVTVHRITADDMYEIASNLTDYRYLKRCEIVRLAVKSEDNAKMWPAMVQWINYLFNKMYSND